MFNNQAHILVLVLLSDCNISPVLDEIVNNLFSKVIDDDGEVFRDDVRDIVV